MDSMLLSRYKFLAINIINAFSPYKTFKCFKTKKTKESSENYSILGNILIFFPLFHNIALKNKKKIDYYILILKIPTLPT